MSPAFVVDRASVARAASRLLRRLSGLLLAAVCATASFAAPVDTPPELAGWRDWVMHGLEHRACPFIASADPADRDSYRCTWPERLALRVDGAGGEFTQRWRVFADSWVTLPGSVEYWPREVRRDGDLAPVVVRDGEPQLRLAAGTHTLSGRFDWDARPESLPVAPRTALIELTVDGQRIAQPERPGGALWLGQRRSAPQAAELEVQVYRLLRDEIPGRLLTRIRLQAAGEAREERLARVLPEGFVPVALESALAARLDADGRLRVQLRPGSFEITLDARGPGVLATVARPPRGPGAWARDEIWSFRGEDRLRVAAVSGAESVDPAQVAVPEEWRGLPAFRVGAGGRVVVEERSRGLAAVDDNRLTLSRELWLDFDHAGFTARDRIAGQLRRDWRLDMQAPFTLANAESGGDTLLITAGKGAGTTGVELRTPQLSVTTLARVTGTRGALPATGWRSRFDQVSGSIHLPPGHRLIAATSDWTDIAGGSWWSNWGLWSFFGLCIVVAMTHRLCGRVPAALAAGAMVLMYQEEPGTIWLWANLLVAIAVARAVPVEGRFRHWAQRYRLASFVLLALVLLPLAFTQIRLALHPQLDVGGYGYRMADLVLAQNRTATAVQPMADVAVQPPAEVATVESAPAAPPVPEPRRSVLTGEAASVASGGLNVLQRVQRYASGTALQAGPGVPDWRYLTYPIAWSGPVEATDTLRVLYVGPWLLGLWRIAGVLLLGAWFLWLLRAAFGDDGRWPRVLRRDAAARAGGTPSASGAVLFVALALALGAAAGATPARAEATPDAQLLEQLRQRLAAPPPCAPSCAEITAADIVVDGARLEVTLTASALANVALALPHAGDRWPLDEVGVDGASGLAIAREGDGAPWVALAPGVRRIRLAGRLADVASLQLVFPQAPRAVTVRATGWSVAGVNAGRLVSGTLEFTRTAAPALGKDAGGVAARAAAGGDFPPFVRVQRRFDLALDWSVATEVWRLAPAHAAVTVEVPLIGGESVLTPGVEVTEARNVLVGLAPDQPAFGWTSGLPRGTALALTVPTAAARTEIWTFRVNPQWRVSFAGLPAVLPDAPDGAEWIYTYYPRAGETLRVSITRPRAVPGATLAIDSAAQRLRVGARTTDATLSFAYRSTQGGRHAIQLPTSARVQSVSVDGSPLAIRPEPSGELSLALLPGSHAVEVRYELPDGAGLMTRPPLVDLRAPAGNVQTQLELPVSRWSLLKLDRDAGVGPAILYWSELAAFLVLAWALGRQAWSPLKVHEWLLLGVGLSTQSWGVLATVVLWFVALRWRAGWSHGRVRNWRFNLVQVALAAFTCVALSGLLFSGIQYGFLSTPDMGVAGGGSAGNLFAWFADRTAGPLPQPVVFSVPLWVYKLLVFAWALWIAARLAFAWLPWAWRAWTRDGFWRRGTTVAGG